MDKFQLKFMDYYHLHIVVSFCVAVRTLCNLLTAFGYINGIYSPYHRLLRYHTANEKEQKNRLLSFFRCIHALCFTFFMCNV